MLKKDILPIEVPNYEELSSKHLWPTLQDDEQFLRYFPTTLPEGKYPCRSYFFTILNTLHPNYVKEILEHAVRKRHGGEAAAEKQEAIELTDEWYSVLEQMPYNSRKYLPMMMLTIAIGKSGKTLHLLKKKSKARVGGQKRRKIEIAGTLAEYQAAR